jgi:threonine efflux protein
MSGTLDLLAFAGVMALGQFSPGPDMILLTRTALKSGARSGVVMAIGISCGLAFHSTIAFAGLSLVLQRSVLLGSSLRWAAAIYLLWICHKIAREHFVKWYSGAKPEEVKISSSNGSFMRGLTCNLLNPKVAIFLAAISVPFLKGNHPSWWPIALGAIVVLQGAILWGLWAVLLQWRPLSQRYRKLETWIDGAFVLVLLSLSIFLMIG